MITIIGLGNGCIENMPKQAEKAFLDSDMLLLQTGRIPLAEYLAMKNIRFETLDDIYETAEDFDDWAAQSVNRIKQMEKTSRLGVCLLGDGITGTLSSLLHGLCTAVIPGLPLGRIAAGMAKFPGVVSDVFARDIQSFEPGKDSFAVTEIDTRLKASEVKLRLDEYYSPETEVTFVDTFKENVYTIPLYEIDRMKEYNAFCCLLVKGQTFFEKERYGFLDLVHVLKLLRGPGGCPWDRKQTHESLKQCLLEEAYEVLEAIEARDDEKLCDELGDLLLQIVFHAGIGQDRGSFTSRDVTTAICRKMIVRHPHVFGKEHCETADDVITNWEKIKKAQRGCKSQTDVMEDVAKTLPALMYSYKIQQKAAQVGFDWKEAKDAFYKIREETEELWECLEQGDKNVLQDELGDLLFAVVNVARKLKLEPELALRSATEKFIKRFSAVELLARQEGKDLQSMTLNEMDTLWNCVKKQWHTME